LEDLPEWIQGPEPERLIQIGLELGEIGPVVENAVGEMIAEQRVSDLLGVLESATAEPESLDRVWDMVANPQTVLQLLQSEPPGFDALDRLLPRLDLESAEVMIEVLGEVESASRSEEIIARIVRLGPGVRPAAVARLDDERWHVRRNMLALLSQFDDLPEDFSLGPYLVDPDARVRREAMRLGLKTWTEIETIIVAALEDDDPQIVELGVEAARRECPAEVVPFLVTMALDLKAAPINRVGSIRALAASGSDRALPALLKITWPRKFFWLRGLGVNSSEMLASLAELAARWPEDPHAARVLKKAGRSKDAQIRAVARPKKAAE
jgi:hypothetical protein